MNQNTPADYTIPAAFEWKWLLIDQLGLEGSRLIRIAN
jgi:hypothetical protein